jgi:hypothetical protein
VQKCTTPCAYRQQRKPMQQTSLAAHVCSTTTGCLFITEGSSKRQLLVDTCSNVCVYPHRLVPSCKEWVNYDLCAANGTTIHTYGWLPQPQLRSTPGFHVAVRRGQCHIPHHWCRFSPVSASWWTAETTGYWMGSCRCLYRPKPPVR